jgi:hypothetical protein
MVLTTLILTAVIVALTVALIVLSVPGYLLARMELRERCWRQRRQQHHLDIDVGVQLRVKWR